jgi:GNAT superfamily N-acetyltransferase
MLYISTDAAMIESCPTCGTPRLQAAGFPGRPRAVCARCGLCWETKDGWGEVDTLACPGCPSRVVCESRATWLGEALTSIHEVAGRMPVLVRPLLYSDRYELADAYLHLTDGSRRRRFFAAPAELSEDDLEYLTNIDYNNHFALAAFAVDQDGLAGPGVGVGRFVRDRLIPSRAEVAITVVDVFQHLGIGTLLLLLLADRASSRGITTFISYVRWENEEALAGLRQAGALIEPHEPGIALVEIEIPAPEQDAGDSLVRTVLRHFARVGGVARA